MYIYMYIHVFTMLNMGVYVQDCVDSAIVFVLFDLLVVYSLFVT